ncbi:MAG: hypothetical protein R6X32_20810 [Chloroflexota bacterium]
MARYYEGDRRYHLVCLNFEVMWLAGQLGLGNETSAYGYFSREEIASMDIIEPHKERVQDIWESRETPFIR